MLQITDEGTHVLVNNDQTQTIAVFPKNRYLIGIDNINRNKILVLDGANFKLSFDYSSVLTPTSSSPAELVEILSGYFFDPNSGGDASAANQLLQIAESEQTNTTLDEINAKTPSLVDSAQPIKTMSRSVTDTINSLNDEATLAVDGFAGVAIDLRGTFSATVTFVGSIDGVNFFNLIATPVASAQNVNTVSTATAPGAWFINCAGLHSVRARATAYTSGSIVATLRATTVNPWMYTAVVGSTNAISGTVTAGISAGTNVIGDVGIQARANATGAASRFHLLGANSTNPTVVKASAGRLFGFVFTNSNNTVKYVKFHNQSTTPTAGTSVYMSVAVYPNMPTILSIPVGIAFSTGIAFTTVTGIADNSTTVIEANDLLIEIFYS